MPTRALRWRPSSRACEDAGIPNNTALIFSELMDSKSLFLTANADTIYFWVNLDVTKGPIVVETPPLSLGVVDDMWFQWVTDFGLPGPDRGEGGKYLFVPPGYKGELPGGGYFVQKMRTTRATMLGRSFLEKNDPKPVVALIKKTLKIYPYLPGGYGTSIGSALQGKATLARTPDHKLDWAFLRPQEPVKFTEGSGKVMNTVPPNDFSYFEMLNDLVQKEPVGALDPEIMGSLAAIGIVKGKPFNPDARMKKILTDAAAIGTAAARTLNWKSAPVRRGLLLPQLSLVQPALHRRLQHGDAATRRSAPTASSPPIRPPGARTLNVRTVMFFALYLHHARDDHAPDGHRLAVPRRRSSIPRANILMAARPTRSRCLRTSRRGSSGPSPFTTTRRARCSTPRSATRAPAARAIRRPPQKPAPTARRPCISARPSPTA